jgi:signal transduction histidine kinase
MPDLTLNARRAADPQARANKLDLVERLADDLAHEIKNPLHSMVINLEVLKRRITRPGGSEPDELMRYAEVLASELERVNRRIELLLRMVRPERGADPTTLYDTVEELLDVLELERDRRHIGIELHRGGTSVRPHLVPSDARQLVLNLLLDAIDQIEPGDVLAVRAEPEPALDRLRLSTSAARFDAGAAPSAAVADLARDLGGSVTRTAYEIILEIPARAT